MQSDRDLSWGKEPVAQIAEWNTSRGDQIDEQGSPRGSVQNAASRRRFVDVGRYNGCRPDHVQHGKCAFFRAGREDITNVEYGKIRPVETVYDRAHLACQARIAR